MPSVSVVAAFLGSVRATSMMISSAIFNVLDWEVRCLEYLMCTIEIAMEPKHFLVEHPCCKTSHLRAEHQTWYVGSCQTSSFQTSSTLGHAVLKHGVQRQGAMFNPVKSFRHVHHDCSSCLPLPPIEILNRVPGSVLVRKLGRRQQAMRFEKLSNLLCNHCKSWKFNDQKA